MTEEIEAHVLKKYEILQKLGKYTEYFLKLNNTQKLSGSNQSVDYRQGCIRYRLEGHRQEDKGHRGAKEEL